MQKALVELVEHFPYRLQCPETATLLCPSQALRLPVAFEHAHTRRGDHVLRRSRGEERCGLVLRIIEGQAGHAATQAPSSANLGEDDDRLEVLPRVVLALEGAAAFHHAGGSSVLLVSQLSQS